MRQQCLDQVVDALCVKDLVKVALSNEDVLDRRHCIINLSYSLISPFSTQIQPINWSPDSETNIVNNVLGVARCRRVITSFAERKANFSRVVLKPQVWIPARLDVCCLIEKICKASCADKLAVSGFRSFRSPPKQAVLYS